MHGETLIVTDEGSVQVSATASANGMMGTKKNVHVLQSRRVQGLQHVPLHTLTVYWTCRMVYYLKDV